MGTPGGALVHVAAGARVCAGGTNNGTECCADSECTGGGTCTGTPTLTFHDCASGSGPNTVTTISVGDSVVWDYHGLHDLLGGSTCVGGANDGGACDPDAGTAHCHVCTGGANNGTQCTSNGTCTGGGTCDLTGTCTGALAEQWDGGTHSAGYTFEHQFRTPGTYPYLCSLHAATGMKGTVIVAPALIPVGFADPPFGLVSYAPLDGDHSLIIAHHFTNRHTFTGAIVESFEQLGNKGFEIYPISVVAGVVDRGQWQILNYDYGDHGAILLEGKGAGWVALAGNGAQAYLQVGPNDIVLEGGTGIAYVEDGGFRTNGLTLDGPVHAGTGLKHVRKGAAGCATSASLGATCTDTLTWPGTAFASTSYTALCQCDGITSGVPIAYVTGKAAGTVTVTTTGLTAAAAQCSNLDCVALHD